MQMYFVILLSKVPLDISSEETSLGYNVGFPIDISWAYFFLNEIT